MTETGMADGPRGSGVQSVERALDILEFLSRSEDELGVSEIGRATGLAAGGVNRLVGGVAARGHVHKNARTRSEERRVGEGVDLGGRRIIKKKKLGEHQAPVGPDKISYLYN